MSKHHTHYNHIAREAAAAKEPEIEVNEIEVDVDDSASSDPVEVAEPEIEVNKDEPLVGVTTTTLNIRENPVVAADNVVTVVNEGTVVMIDYPVADGDWFKVYTEAGVEGYCMKEFVKINN